MGFLSPLNLILLVLIAAWFGGLQELRRSSCSIIFNNLRWSHNLTFNQVSKQVCKPIRKRLRRLALLWTWIVVCWCFIKPSMAWNLKPALDEAWAQRHCLRAFVISSRVVSFQHFFTNISTSISFFRSQVSRFGYQDGSFFPPLRFHFNRSSRALCTRR